MAFRPDILAGRAVILVNIEDTIDKQLRGIRTRLRRFSNSLGDIGGDLFRGGTVGILGTIFPVKEFIDFQDQLLFIQTKLQATDMEMLQLEQTIRDLGKATSFTSKEVGQAAQKLAQAGFSLSETQDSLQAALDLGRGGQVDLSTATDILANSIRTYGLNAKQAQEVSSKFITAARLGTLDIVDLNEAIKNSATTFRLLGLDLSTSLALITRLSTASLRGTIAGTSLNRAFQKLATENKKLADAGITLEDNDLKNPLQILTKIEEVLGRLNEKEGVAFLNDLLGIRGGRGLGGILIQGLGPLDDTIQQIRGSMDEAASSAAKLDSRLGGVYRRALSSFQEFLLAAGGTSEGPLSKFGESLRKAFNELSALSTKNPELLQTLFLLPPIALAAGAAFLGFAFALNKVASAITPLISLNGLLFKSLAKIVGGNLQALGQGRKGLAALGLGSKVRNPSFNLGGILSKGIKTAATTQGLRNPLRYFAMQFVVSLEKAFKTIKGRRLSLIIFGPIFTSIESFARKFRSIPRLLVGGKSLLQGMFNVNYLAKIISGFKSLGNILRGLFVGLNVIRRFAFSFSGVLALVEALIIFGPKIPPIRDFFRNIGTYLKDIVAIGPAVVPQLKQIFGGFKEIFRGDITSGISTIKQGLGDLVEIVGIKLTNAWRKLIREIKPFADAIQQVGNGLLQIVNGIFSIIGEIGGVAIEGVGRGLADLGGGSLTENLTANLNVFFAGVFELFKVIGVQILRGFERLLDVSEAIESGIRSILAILLQFVSNPVAEKAYRELNRKAGLAPDGTEVDGVSGRGGRIPFREVIGNAIDRIMTLSFKTFTPGDLRPLIDENEAAALREVRGQNADPLDIAPLSYRNAEADKILEASRKVLNGMLKRPDMKKVEQEAFQNLRESREMLELRKNTVDAPELTRVFTKLQSVVGSFSQTRGQLLKLASRNDELKELKGINKGVADLNKAGGPKFAS